MIQDDYLARIDQRLESLVSQIERLLEYLYADSTSTKAAIFGLGDYLQASNERMDRIESSIEKSNERMERIESNIERSSERMDRIENTITHQTAIADKQADSVRQLIEMLNRRQA
jgi:methyl-accepting chemotaxis protein